MEMSTQRVQQGIDRLLEAPRDLRRWDEHIGDPGRQNASARHAMLFAAYKSELHLAAERAEEIWDREIAERVAQGAGANDAVREQWFEFPAGPAARPEIVAVVRRTWLACDALNRELPSSQAVAPEIFVLKWLVGDLSIGDSAVRVLACVPYWPLGLDREGKWL